MTRKTKYILTIVFGVAVFFALSCLGQNTGTVVGTVVDTPDGVAWVGGTWSATFYNPQGGTPRYINSGLPVVPLQYAPTPLGAGGSFTVSSLPLNNAIAPAGTMWVFTFCPNAIAGCVTLPPIAVNQGGDKTAQIASFIKSPRFPASGANQYGYADSEIEPLPAPGGFYYNVTQLCQRVWNGASFACQGTGGGGTGVGTTMGISIGNQLHCDPTGATDCTTLISNAITAQPNATILYDLPVGATSATYLIAGSNNVSFPSSSTAIFTNGAQISTGNQVASTITNIQRTAYNSTPYSISLAGCYSSATVSGNNETFTNCPNTFLAHSIAYTSGTTNVPACPYGCHVTSVTNGNQFTLLNPFVTAAASSVQETGGTAVVNESSYYLSLATLGATSSSTASPGTITINVANNFPQVPFIVVLYQTTNVPGGTYVAIPSTINSTSFSVVCATGCVNQGTAVETGTANIPAGGGGMTYVHFSTPLAGLGPPGFTNSANATTPNLGKVICTGTSNFNGPYWITAIADSQDIVLLDPRGTVPTETTGSCYIPYTVTYLGSVQAQPGAQIVAPNSAVIFQGSNTSFVGWYGAKGVVGSPNGDDSLAFQSALFWNPGKHIMAGQTGLPSFGADTAGYTTYNIKQTLQMYGNMQDLDGGVASSLWEGGTTLNCNPSYRGACIMSRPDTASPKIENLAFYGQSCAVNYVRPIPQLKANPDYDGWVTGSGQSQGTNLAFRCFGRTAIQILSSINAFEYYVMGASEPDYWRMTNLFVNAPQAYGVDCIGTDCNGGTMTGNSDLRGAGLGGINCSAQICPTMTGVNGENDTNSYVTAGVLTGTVTVNNPGAWNTSCTAQFTNALTPNMVVNGWIIASNVSGSLNGVANSSGGYTLSAWPITAINSAAENITFTCAMASGGPGIATITVADSNSTYTALSNFANGVFSNTWQVTGVGLGQGMVSTGGYMESSAGCPYGSGYISGASEMLAFINGVSCNGQYSTYPNAFKGSYWAGSGSGISGVANTVTINNTPSYNSGNMYLEFINGYGGAGRGTAFTGNTAIRFCQVLYSDCDYIMEESTGGVFILSDNVVGDNAYSPIFMRPYDSGKGQNYLSVNAPSLTGAIHFQYQYSSVGLITGPVDFFAPSGAAATTTITTTGTTTPAITTTKIYTVVTLPTCNSTTNIGMKTIVNNANPPTYLQPVTGGGSTFVPVICNGTAWVAD